jgi:hypothetical protein
MEEWCQNSHRKCDLCHQNDGDWYNPDWDEVICWLCVVLKTPWIGGRT